MKKIILEKAYKLLQEKLLVEDKRNNENTEVGQIYDNLDENTRFICELLFGFNKKIEANTDNIKYYQNSLTSIREELKKYSESLSGFNSRAQSYLDGIDIKYRLHISHLEEFIDNQKIEIKKEFNFINESVNDIKNMRSTSVLIIFPIVMVAVSLAINITLFYKLS